MTNKKLLGCGMTDCKTPLGALIRQKRLALGMTQVTLASAADITQESLSHYEIGSQMPPKDRLERLAKALNCSIEELQQCIPPKPRAQPTTELGRLIRARREELGLSMEDVAKTMRVSIDDAERLLDLRMSRHIDAARAAQLVRILQFDPAQLTPFLVADIQSRSPFGKIVTERRVALGMNIEALGKKLGVGREYVRQIETGILSLSNSNSDDMFQRLAAALQLGVRERQAVRPMRRQKIMDRPPLAQELSRARLELHLTQGEVARRAGVSIATICLMETGRHCPSNKLLRRIMAALELPTSDEAIAQLHQTSTAS